MKKFGFLILISIFFSSCSEKIDLESLEYGKKISILENSKNIEKSTSYFFDNPSIIMDDIESFTFSDINLSKFEIENGYPYSKNEFSFLVNNYNDKLYEGFAVRVVNDDGNQILDYLNAKYGKSDNWDQRGNGIAYFWENKESWIFFFQSEERNKIDVIYKQSILIMSKKNALLRSSSSNNENKITLLDYFKYIYPKEK